MHDSAFETVHVRYYLSCVVDFRRVVPLHDGHDTFGSFRYAYWTGEFYCDQCTWLCTPESVAWFILCRSRKPPLADVLLIHRQCGRANGPKFVDGLGVTSSKLPQLLDEINKHHLILHNPGFCVIEALPLIDAIPHVLRDKSDPVEVNTVFGAERV